MSEVLRRPAQRSAALPDWDFEPRARLASAVASFIDRTGAGNLLGNLLCGVANLLNGQTLLGQQVAGLLNIVQQLVATPGLLNL